MTVPNQQPEIATLPPLPALNRQVPVSKRTGEPPRPWSVVLGYVLALLAAGVVIVAYAHHWWLAAHPDSYADSAQLIRMLDPDPGKWLSLTLEGVLAAVALVTAGACGVAGFQAWNGWAWSRWAGVAATLLSGLTATLFSLWALPAVAWSLLATACFWLPPSLGYYRSWELHRFTEPNRYRRPERIYYGRLPRYR